MAKETQEPQVVALFCEDIREELGNKVSLMGILRATFTAPEYPFVMPRLGVATRILLPKEYPLEFLNGRLEASWSDEPIAEFEPTKDELNKRIGQLDTSEDSERIAIDLRIIGLNIDIMEEGKIKMIISINKKIYNAGSLRFAQTSEKIDFSE